MGVEHYSMFAWRHLWTAPHGEGKKRAFMCQFHQHFTCAFLVRKCFALLFSSCFGKSTKALSYKKCAYKKLMKWTTGRESKVVSRNEKRICEIEMLDMPD